MLDYALLDALGAVVRLGSFDRAARELNVTPSAVSQRVKLLEERVGSVLVKRGQPCIATPPGALLCRHIERVQRLETELGGQFPTLPGMLAESWPTFRVAVNDDSVGTWFIDAISGFCAEREMLLDLVIDDQEYTAQQLRDAYDLVGECRAAFDRLAAPYDAILTPAAVGEARIGLADTGDHVFNRTWTLLHVPCVAVPGFTGPNGLPVGLQLVGPRFEDAQVLAAAQTIGKIFAAAPRAAG